MMQPLPKQYFGFSQTGEGGGTGNTYSFSFSSTESLLHFWSVSVREGDKLRVTQHLRVKYILYSFTGGRKVEHTY